MRKIKKFNFIKWNYNTLISSLKKINLNIFLIVLLDFLFYFISTYLFIFWFQRLQQNIAGFNIPTNLLSLSQEKAQQFLSGIRIFYILIILSFVIFLLIIIFLASILKGIIWAKTTKASITLKLISKFFLLNIVWMSFWFVVIISMSVLIEPQSAPLAMGIVIIIALYFTNTLYTIFMRSHSFKAIIEALKLNIAKIHLFLLPYFFIMVLFFIIMKLSNLLKFIYSDIIFALIMLFYIAITRYYVSTLISEIKELNK